MIYLTYNDQPSGVFSSQVNDVCNYLNRDHGARIRLVAIISLHDFAANRRKIKAGLCHFLYRRFLGFCSAVNRLNFLVHLNNGILCTAQFGGTYHLHGFCYLLGTLHRFNTVTNFF